MLVILLQEPSSVEKIMEIDEHIGCAMSGLIADARTLVEHARVETQVIKTYYWHHGFLFCDVFVHSLTVVHLLLVES